jgi:hypothetical protein
VLVTYLIPSRCIATAQGEHVSSLTLMSKGEKKCGNGKYVIVVWLDVQEE